MSSPDLDLTETHLAKQALDVAEMAVDKARKAYHARVAALVGGGASLREVAELLGLSHQRIHQMIGDVHCLFCKATKVRGAKLITGGTGTYLCERCATAAREAAQLNEARRVRPGVLLKVHRVEKACSFCGAPSGTRTMISHGHSHLCSDCVTLSSELFGEIEEGG